MSLLPPGITCPDWQPAAPGAKRCREYVPQGGCQLPSRGVCCEWVKLNPSSPLAKLLPASTAVARALISGADLPPAAAPAGPPVADLLRTPAQARPAAPQTAPDGAPLVLIPSEPPKPSTAALRAREALARAHRGDVPEGPVLTSSVDPAEELLERRVAELEQISAEIELSTDHGPIVLVRARTPGGRPDGRRELTFRESALLTYACATFPGARVIALNSPNMVGKTTDEALHGAPGNASDGTVCTTDVAQAALDAERVAAHGQGKHCGVGPCGAVYDKPCGCPTCPGDHDLTGPWDEGTPPAVPGVAPELIPTPAEGWDEP